MKSALVTSALIAVTITAGAVPNLPSKPVLTLELAKRIASEAERYAREHRAPGAAIAIVDDRGTALFLERLDGTFPMGSAISIGKARTAALFQKPTRAFEDSINKGRTAMTALDNFTPLIGGAPIEIDGQIIGAVGVSGAASAQQDGDIADAAAKAAPALLAAP